MKMDIVILTKCCRYIYDIPDFLLFRFSYLMLVASCFSKCIYIMNVIVEIGLLLWLTDDAVSKM